jgi:hypothetical protein
LTLSELCVVKDCRSLYRTVLAAPRVRACAEDLSRS